MADDFSNAAVVEQVGSTKTTTTTGGPPVGFHPEFIKTVPGILKIVEIAMSMATFICAAVWSGSAAGWVEFVSMSALITCVIIVVMRLTYMVYKVPGPRMLIWLIYHSLFSLFYFIAACVAIGFAAKWYSPPACDACAVFATLTTPVFCYDTFRHYTDFRNGEDDIMVTTTTTVTMTTTDSRSAAAVY